MPYYEMCFIKKDFSVPTYSCKKYLDIKNNFAIHLDFNISTLICRLSLGMHSNGGHVVSMTAINSSSPGHGSYKFPFVKEV